MYGGVQINSVEIIIRSTQQWMYYHNQEHVGYIIPEARILSIGIILAEISI